MNKMFKVIMLTICILYSNVYADKSAAIKARLDGQKAAFNAAKNKETNCFSLFTPTATSLNKTNEYLLSYLSLMIYAQNLGPALGVPEEDLQTSRTLFETKYKERVGHFFQGNTVFTFMNPTNRVLYNPEAMCIATDKEIIIVFRGTDRLVNKTEVKVGGAIGDKVGGFLEDLIYDWGEWIITDANVQPLQTPAEGIGGKLHKGMKQSLDLVRDRIVKFALDNGGATKPVWITGHSLGGAHAQIMGGYLKKRGANVKGVYVFNSCHPGTPEYASSLNSVLGKETIQRFEYLDDPICMLPPQTSATTLFFGYTLPPGSPVGGFGRAGIRNVYSKLDGNNFHRDEAERQEGRSNTQNLGRSGSFNPLSICFHNPHWICNAAYLELPQETRAKLPTPPRLEDCEMCLLDAMETGKTGAVVVRRIVEDIAETAAETVENITFNATNIIANFAGTAIPEGDYYIRCNKGKKYLDIKGGCMNDNGCNAQLWDLGRSGSNNIFTIKKEGLTYRVTLKSNGKSLEVTGEERFNNGGQIQLWDNNIVPVANANQKWYFYKLNGGNGKCYLIVNSASMKVLDAVNNGVNTNGGGVQIYEGRSNDQTQVWILEKAN